MHSRRVNRGGSARIANVRYPKEHKEQARRRLVAGGARLAKKRGFAGAGIDDLAAAAGVTSGSVYKHFGGKSELLAAIVEAELARSAALFSAVPRGDQARLGAVMLARAMQSAATGAQALGAVKRHARSLVRSSAPRSVPARRTRPDR